MKEVFDIEEFRASGLGEAYVLGSADPGEMAEVEALASKHPEVRDYLRGLEDALENYAMSIATPPPPTVKPFIRSTIQFMKRAASGQLNSTPVPELSPAVTASDFATWLDDPSYSLPSDFVDYYAHLIGVSETASSAIVWLRDGAPLENHAAQIEKFLVLEGSCDILIGEEVHSLSAGSYFAIPPNNPHIVKVTSQVICKIILQRVAA